MSWPFDPFGFRWSHESPSAELWHDRWLEATTWWADALADREGRWRSASGQILGQTVEGVVRGFRDRRMEIKVGDRAVRGTLGTMSLGRGRAGALYLDARLNDVECEGLAFDELVVAADSVSLTPPPQVRLAISGVRVRGRAPLTSVLAWASSRLQGWRLAPSTNWVRAVPRSGRVEFRVDASVHDHCLEMEIREARWRRLRLRLPGWLRLSRALALPVLPGGARICFASRRGAVIDFELWIPQVSEAIELGRLRETISGLQ